ncbi:OmpA family protein [Reyranella sp.]|uniref:OmpA family protein n=1 Tax=Reyranella sp. TaxID=1929291 RepID=UPI003D135E0F
MKFTFTASQPKSLFSLGPRQAAKQICQMIGALLRLSWNTLIPFERTPGEPQSLPSPESAVDEKSIEQCLWIYEQVETTRDDLEKKAQSTFSVIAVLVPLIGSIFLFLVKETSPFVSDRFMASVTYALGICGVLLLMGFISAIRAASVKQREILYVGAVVDPENGYFRKYDESFHARGLIYCAIKNAAMNGHIAQLVKGAQILTSIAVVSLFLVTIFVGSVLSAHRPPPPSTRISGPVDLSVASVSALKDTHAGQSDSYLPGMERKLAEIEVQLSDARAMITDQNARMLDLDRKTTELYIGRIEELARYRSQFFGKLREVLGRQPNIEIVGDRFVFQSEVLFPLGSAQLQPSGEAQLVRVAQQLVELTRIIPKDIDWVLQVNGHTDGQPISTAAFRTNWELSVARAVEVVRFLSTQGIQSERLAAAGYGEYRPLSKIEDGRNRRIELKLTTP